MRHHRGAMLSPAAVSVIDAVISHGPLSQADIVRMTRYSSARISAATRELREGGWLRDVGQRKLDVAPGAVLKAMAAALTPVRSDRIRPSTRPPFARASPV